MKITHRIPTNQFAYIELEFNVEESNESISNALTDHAELLAKYNEPGLPANEWAKLRNKMFTTGEFDPNIEGLSKAQRFFINECKKAHRASGVEPVVE